MKKILPSFLLLAFFFVAVTTKAQPIAVSKTNPTKVYIHYMPWFFAPRNPGTGVTNYTLNVNATGSWGFHWTQDGSKANPNTFTNVTDYTGATVSVRNVDAHYHPLIGPYDGSDPDVLEYHLLLMKLSGIDGVMIDWYGLGGNGAADAGANQVNSAAIISDIGNVGLKYGLVMEDAAWTNAQANGNFAVSNYFTDPNYIKLGDMRGSLASNANAPLVCVFGPQQFKTPGEWNSYLSGNTKAFLPLYNQAAQIGTDAGGTFMWPNPQSGQNGTPPAWYANTANYYTGGATTLHNNKTEAGTTLGNNVTLGTAYQGFFDFYLTNAASTASDADGIIPRNYNGNTLSSTLSLFNQNKSVMDGLQIATWNDFSEGTMIEPTVEFGFASLDTIQKFTGVSYTENDLKQVYRLFTLRKQYVGNSTIQSELNQVFNYFIQLDIANAKSLMDCIVNSGGTNCTTLPIITSANADTVAAGTALNYQITATTHNNDAIIRYGASGLPAGLSINTSTGVISGASYTVGIYSATDSVTDANGTSFTTLIINITNPATDIPYNGVAATIPGIIQAENYDLGGEGIAYHDDDATNNGTQYRPNEGPDIEATTDIGGGYDVGWINAGEWMQYIVNVTQAGTYTMTARVASGTAGTKQFHVLLNTSTNLGTLTVPATGGWQTWQTTAGVTTPILSVGQDTLRIFIDATGFNINYLTFTLNSTSTPLISSALTDTGTIGIPLNYNITASNTPNSYNATNLPAGLTINTSTGLISGTPTALGTNNVTVSATNNVGTGNNVLAITINPAAPIISSALTTSGMIGSPFSYTITGSSSPTSYHATNLPAGLTINTSTGVISGTPTTLGISNVIISATNAGGTGTNTLVLTINPASTTHYLSLNGARQNNGTTEIQWSVDSEVSISEYELFRSTDSSNSNNYSVINTVTQIANAYINTPTIYDTTDNNPVPGDMYYYIKAIGSNGSVFYSDTIKVNKIQTNDVYPNPVTNGIIYIPFNNASDYTVRIINGIGQPVYTTNIIIAGSTVYPLQLPGKLPSGIYQLELINSSGTKTVYKISKINN
jgi:carbohydrate binding protein with CBM6 domain/putative Ig domain-containing protein